MKTNTLDFDAQALREKILDLAMRGKLVPQDPNDEPASVLLKKIKAEKEQLIKEKKIKKSKPLAPITDDEKPFDIPDSWEWVRLGDVGEIISGGTPKTSEKSYWENGNIPWITPAIMSDTQDDLIFNNKQIKFINKLGLEKSSAHLILKNSLVVSSRAPIGYVNIVPFDYTTNQGCKSVSLYSNTAKEFVYFALKNAVPDMIKRASGTTFKEISGTKFGQTIIPLPPLEEQSRIAAKIAQLFALLRKVESSTQQYAKLQTLLKSKVLDLAMRGKLVEQDPHDEPASALLEKIKIDTNQRIEIQKIKKIKFAKHSYDDQIKYSIPDTWVWTRIGDILYKLTDGVHQRPNYTNEGVPFLSVKDMSQGTIDFSDCKYISLEDHEKIYPRCNSEYGDVLLSKVGTTGVPAIVETKEIFDLFVSVALLKFNHKMINQGFLRYLIMSPIVQQQVSINTRGVGNKNWVLRDIAGTLIPLPPKEQQNKIANMLSKLLFLI
ncbi:restriction endonuclease subunit S [Lactobacillus crispatus]|uniref:restriction endonuclease subunit S n=1 Tax=Lactobacillus crispatus TaxID=47770 RepID=UPI00103F05CE|nr:restriction endonuclease subunit S [Lactobacillus crispatus]